MIVSAHAAQRYVERVAPTMTLAQARAEIRKAGGAIETAIRFGASIVRLGNGARLKIEDGCVVTVLPARRRHHQREAGE